VDGQHLLIVDDDPGTCQTLKHVLRESGYEPRTASSGEEALAACRDTLFDLVLVDLRLPDIPGIDLIGRIKSISPHTEAIVVTGYASLETAVQAMQGAAFSYVTKPIDMDHLLATVAKALEKGRLQLAHGEVEEALRRSEARYRLIVENISDLIGVTTLEGTYTYVSPSHRQLGYDPEDLLGRQWLDFVHPDDRLRLDPPVQRYTRDHVARLLAEKQTVSEALSYRFSDKGENWHDIETTANYVRGLHGADYSVVFVSRDVTHRRLMQGERQAPEIEQNQAE
jgi:PAS domain S-box-containing protein